MLVVHGRRFRNSAAKFWSALIDELLENYPECRRIALEALNEGRLDPDLLSPETELERELNRNDLSMNGAGEAWRQALADFEIYGPPGSVGLRIYSRAGKQTRLSLPMDCVDAEIFLYLLAWLMEWADLPPNTWNDLEVKCSFAALDPVRKYNYLFDFTVGHKFLSEGLFSWRLDLGFERSNYMPVVSARPGNLSAMALNTDSERTDK